MILEIGECPSHVERHQVRFLIHDFLWPKGHLDYVMLPELLHASGRHLTLWFHPPTLIPSGRAEIVRIWLRRLLEPFQSSAPSAWSTSASTHKWRLVVRP